MKKEEALTNRSNILRFFLCLIRHHEWTTALEQRGGKPREGLKTVKEVTDAMREDSKLFCKHCQKESKLNGRLDNVFPQ